MLQLLKAEIRYNWWLFAAAPAVMIVATSALLAAGERRWHEPSVLLFNMIMAVFFVFSLRSRKENRMQQIISLPVQPFKQALLLPVSLLIIVTSSILASLIIIYIYDASLVTELYQFHLWLSFISALGAWGCFVSSWSIAMVLPTHSNSLRVLSTAPLWGAGMLFIYLPVYPKFYGLISEENLISKDAYLIALALMLFVVILWVPSVLLHHKRNSFFNK